MLTLERISIDKSERPSASYRFLVYVENRFVILSRKEWCSGNNSQKTQISTDFLAS